MKLLILIITLFTLLIIQPLPSFAKQVETVDVPPGNMQSLEFDLVAGENFIGSFTVSGGFANDIKFWVANPVDNHIILRQNVAGEKRFAFTADQNGRYTLFFDNSFARERSKKITLTYEITNQQSKPFFGLPNIGGGCLIATATYGTELAPQVQMLREIRDNSVLDTKSGTAFMIVFNTLYYSFSPAVADLERQNSLFKKAVKLTITPLIVTLSWLQHVDVDSEIEMLGYGVGLILLNISMYFIAPTIILSRLKSKFL
ncbi:MAG: emp24/gp25L/p24 family protein [Nitrososphaerota archaeon]